MSSLRTALLMGACTLFLLVQGLGLHLHAVEHDDAAHAILQPAGHDVGHDHDTAGRHVHALSGFGSDHAAEHQNESAVDLESADQTRGKLPSLNLIAAIAGLLLILAPLSPQRTGSRPPVSLERRRWTHFQPLSHAPPRAG